jgi:hypothetical protein
MDLHVLFPKKPAAAEALSAWASDRKKTKLKDNVHGYIEAYLQAKDVPRPEKVKEDDGWHLLILGSAMAWVPQLTSPIVHETLA